MQINQLSCFLLIQNHAKVSYSFSNKLKSIQNKLKTVPPAESLSETTKNSNEVVENKTTNIKRNSNLDSNVSDSSSAKRKMGKLDLFLEIIIIIF